MNMEPYVFSHVPENHSQPGIFELIKEGTLRKMGKVSKEAIIQKALKNSKYVRDCEIPIPDYDATANDPMPPLPPLALPDESLTNGTNAVPGCTLTFCRLGCVCNSISCEDMYDDYYEKHCRDTGEPACMFGCVCNNGPGPKSNGESRWVISKPYKYKRPRVRDDEDCGFIPLHLRELKGEGGRPKRRAQPPTRYRPDLSKQERLIENGKLELNGVSKRSTRPRRRLCEEEEDDGSDESDERVGKIASKTRSKDSQLSISCAVEQFENELDAVKKRRWAKLEAARRAKAAYANNGVPNPRGRPPKREIKSETASLDQSEESDSIASGNQTDTYSMPKRGRKPGISNGYSSAAKVPLRKKLAAKHNVVGENIKPRLERLREPSKRERKPRRWDLLEPEPRPKRPYNRKMVATNGHVPNKLVGVVQIKQEPKAKPIVKTSKEHKALTVSTFLHVIQIQQPSKTCQGMYAVLRNTSEIITFVSWDQDSNVIPHLQAVKFRFTGTPKLAAYDKGSDIVLLPHIPTQDTVWFFYALKRDYLSWSLVMFPEIHVIFASEVLCSKILENTSLKESQLLDVSDLNVNGTAETKGQHVYLFLGRDDDIFVCGTPPSVFMDKNPSRQSELRRHALLKVRSESYYRSKQRVLPCTPFPKLTNVKSETCTAPTPMNEDISNCSSSVLNKNDKTFVDDSETESAQEKTDLDSSEVLILAPEAVQIPTIPTLVLENGISNGMAMEVQ